MIAQTPRRILAVDDIAFNLDIVAFAFDGVEPPVEVITETDGRRALDLLRQTGADVVLLDLEMPLISGYDVLSAIRADEELRRTPVLVLTASVAEKKKALAMGANDFVAKPFDVEELRLRCLNLVEIKKHHDLMRDLQSIMEHEISLRTSDLASALRLAKHNEYEISLRLGRASEYRDSDSGAHLVRVSRASARLAGLAGFSDADAELILHAAPLHDVGKIGIADAILQKPGALTPDEFNAMKQHTLIGGAILADGHDCAVVEIGRVIAEQHHEKWDGSGYPRGLAGEGIDVFARIVAICDVFDALTSARVYKAALPPDEVLAILHAARGKHFDPTLLDLFVGEFDTFVRERRAADAMA